MIHLLRYIIDFLSYAWHFVHYLILHYIDSTILSIWTTQLISIVKNHDCKIKNFSLKYIFNIHRLHVQSISILKLLAFNMILKIKLCE